MGTRALTANTTAYWEVECGGFYGTSMMFGVARRKGASLYRPMAFENLIGGAEAMGEWAKSAYGLSHHGRLFHGGEVVAERRDEKGSKFPLAGPARVGVLFNGPGRKVEFFVNGEECGVSVERVEMEVDVPYYPVISRWALNLWKLLGGFLFLAKPAVSRRDTTASF